MTRYSWERKLRPALRGTRGYAAQQEAWDAVLPDWRRALELLNGDRRQRPSEEDRDFLVNHVSAALRADDRRLAAAWYCLLMQDLYRRCPALGGWFPE